MSPGPPGKRWLAKPMMNCPLNIHRANRFFSMHRVYFVKPALLRSLWKRLDAYIAVIHPNVGELGPWRAAVRRFLFSPTKFSAEISISHISRFCLESIGFAHISFYHIRDFRCALSSSFSAIDTGTPKMWFILSKGSSINFISAWRLMFRMHECNPNGHIWMELQDQPIRRYILRRPIFYR